KARAGTGHIPGVLRDDGNGGHRLSPERFLSRSTGNREPLQRKDDPAEGVLLVLSAGGSCPPARGASGDGGKRNHFLLFQQFLQDHGADDGVLDRSPARRGKFAAASAVS